MDSVVLLKIFRLHIKEINVREYSNYFACVLFRSLLSSLLSGFKRFSRQEINDAGHLFSLFRWEMYPEGRDILAILLLGISSTSIDCIRWNRRAGE
jgi:hypothetical protein